ncbi:MAG: flavin-containing monooxygenase [Chloroflexota bacterium]
MTPEPIDTVVVGGGQAGLATSYHLSRIGLPHVVLEAGQVGQTWRTERWDSFTLVTQSSLTRLPGRTPPAGEPEFLPRAGIVTMLEGYADTIGAPVRSGVAVLSLGQGLRGDGFRLETSAHPIAARRVVVASGWYRRPRVPELAARLPDRVVQLTTTSYRRPAALPDGGVLVVGSGQAGTQIAEDLQLAGRQVWLSVGSAGRVPRRYRGRDGLDWWEALGRWAVTESDAPDPRGRHGPNPHLSGARGGHTINLHRFARDGIQLVGRVLEVDGERLHLAPDLHDQLASVDRFAATYRAKVDEFIERLRLDAPAADSVNTDEHDGTEGFGVPLLTELDLAREGITAVVWTPGFRPDFGWIRLPVLDGRGDPIHDRGITAVPGLAFVGLRFQSVAGSDLLYGVGAEAASVADRLAAASIPANRSDSGITVTTRDSRRT